jgi:hypothetical protein
MSNKSMVCDDWIEVPLGTLTLNEMCDVCVLLHGDTAERKLIVQPESRIDVSSVDVIINYGEQSKVNANLSSL